MDTLKTVDTVNFEAEVLNNSKPTIVEFGATWCGPCRVMLPIMLEMQSEYPDYSFVKLDIDDNPELLKTYKVKAAPTFISFKDGVQLKVRIGAATKAQLLELVQ